MTKDQEIASLQHKLSNLETSLEATELKLKEHSAARADGDSSRTAMEGLERKISLLEGELDNAEKQLRETTDK